MLCSLNASYSHTAYPLYCLFSVVDKEKYAVSISQFTINTEKEKIVSALYLSGADVIMFSCYLWNITATLAVCSELKKLRDITIILGGSEVSYEYEKYLSLPEIDAICTVEGEGIINRLLEKLSKGEVLSCIDGIKTKENLKSNFVGRNATNFDFSCRPFPYTEEQLSAISEKIVYYETTRGCINNCSFCISSLDHNIRTVSIPRIKQELDIFDRCNVKLVKFIDRTFNYDACRCEEIVSYIIEKNYRARFHFEIKAELMSERLIELFASAPKGMFQLEIGLQTINKNVSSKIRRHDDLIKFSSVFTRLRENNNVHLHADLIALLPGEDIKSFSNGFDYLYKLKPHMLQLGFLKVLGGTYMKKTAETEGIIYSDLPPYEALCTNFISFEEKLKLKNIAFLTDRLYNSGAFTYTLSYLEKEEPSPFALFEKLNIYAEKTSFYENAHSKEELYRFLAGYCRDERFNVYLSFDFVLCLKKLPKFALERSVYELRGDEKYAAVTAPQFMEKLGNEYSGLINAELIKRVDLFRFPFDPKSGETGNSLYAITDKKEVIENRYCCFRVN